MIYINPINGEKIMLNISIICTVKNGSKTIKNTIKSVLDQTLKEWELIIIDDGSTDKTLEIISRYSEIDSRIKVIETKGIGRGAALNLAIENSKGEYVANLDADDLMHPEKLEIQYNIIKEKKQLFLLATQINIIYDEEIVKWDTETTEGVKIEDITQKNLKKNQIDHSSVVMRKNILLEIGKYDESRKSQFDYELWLRAASKGKRLARINRHLVAKRIHKSQSFESKRKGHLFRSISLQTKYIFKLKKPHLIVYPIARLVFGILPFKIRRKIGNIINL